MENNSSTVSEIELALEAEFERRLQKMVSAFVFKRHVDKCPETHGEFISLCYFCKQNVKNGISIEEDREICQTIKAISQTL